MLPKQKINILLAPNSFKECADSIEVIKYLKESLTSERFIFREKAISDGGDGFLNVCKYNLRGEVLRQEITKVYSDDIVEVPYLLTDNGEVYLESAEIIGLKTIPLKMRDPKTFSTKNLGDLIISICKRVNPSKIIIGIGGTGTNDLGLGVCSRFGLKLIGGKGEELEVIPSNFIKVRDIEWEQSNYLPKIECIIDVDNELTGECGATLRYGRQKGASEADLQLMEEGMKNVVNILKQKGIAARDKVFSGAGGGLAAGLNIFLGAEIKSGAKFILDDLGIRDIKTPDLIITGEGAFDVQTLDNKAPGVIIRHFMDKAKVIIICGTATEEVKQTYGSKIKIIELRQYFKSKEESIERFREGIKFCAAEIEETVLSHF